MLGKLLKHDLRAVSRLMVPASLLVLGTTLLGTFSFRFANEQITLFPEFSLGAEIFTIVMYLMFAMSIFALMAYTVASYILVVVHYYRNFFTSEGYLTFTLPVSTSNLIVSKLLASSIWMLFTGAVTIFCICIYFMFGASGTGIVNTEIFSDMWELIAEMWNSINTIDFVFLALEGVLLVIASLLYSILQAFLAITIGCIVAKKHKILASIGFYYIINMIVSAISTVVMLVFFTGSTVFAEVYTYSIIAGTPEANYMGYMHSYMMTTLILYAGLAVAEYFVNRHLIKNKLNI